MSGVRSNFPAFRLEFSFEKVGKLDLTPLDPSRALG